MENSKIDTLTPEQSTRIRPGWLESQRERFAQGRFGEQQTKEPPMPTPTIYLPDTAPITFPWEGTGAECVRIWNAAPAGMLEWRLDYLIDQNRETAPMGNMSSPYQLRPRADYRAPQPGDVVDAQEAWKAVRQGWVVEDCEGGTASGFYVLRHGDGVFMVDGSLDADECPAKFHERLQDVPYTLLRHEPWRCASLATGYVWDGETAEQALRAGMEAKHELSRGWLHAEGESIYNDCGAHINDITKTIGAWFAFSAKNNWALRWPVAKETNMETKDETLSGWAALDALRAGDVLRARNRNDIRVHDGALQACYCGEWRAVSDRFNSVLQDVFTRVPAKPVSKTLKVLGITLTVYADKATYGEWTVNRGIWETAASVMKLLGPDEKWVCDKGALEGAGFRAITATQAGVKVGCKTYTPGDVASIIAAMDELAEGGEG